MGPPPEVPPVRAFTRVTEGPSRRRSSAAIADEAGTRAATAAMARIIFFTVFSSVVWFELGDRDHPFAVRAQMRSGASSAAGIGCCGVLRFKGPAVRHDGFRRVLLGRKLS